MIDIEILTVVFFVAALAPTIVLHEISHGIVADRFGDMTPRMAGRITLDPRKHVDPFGTVILPGLLLLPTLFGRATGLPVFAYAKPMPINPSNLRDPDRQTMWIALWGPLVNLVLAVIGGLALRVVSPEAANAVARFGSQGTALFPLIREAFGALAEFLSIFVFLNVLVAVFNVMPIPPLDGSKVLARFLPPRAREVYRSWDAYGALFILVIFFIFPGAVFGFIGAIVDGLLAVVVG